MIPFPQTGEANAYYSTYIARVPTTNVLELLESQIQDLQELLRDVSEATLLRYPASGEWNIKEVLGHLCDCERLFGYRAMCFAREDATPLPSMEPLDYIASGKFSERSLDNLLEEFTHLRKANIALWKSLSAEQLVNRGIASDNEFTVRAMIYLTAGHCDQHIESLRTVYLGQEV